MATYKRIIFFIGILSIALFFGCSNDKTTSDTEMGQDAVIDSTVIGDAVMDSSVDTSTVQPATLDLPKWPWWANKGMSVSKGKLSDLGGQWCETTGGQGGAPDFFFRWMPMQTVGHLCDPGLDKKALKEMIGRIYLSGWYGGLWFRDNSSLGSGHGVTPGPVKEDDFQKLAENVEDLLNLSFDGTDGNVESHNHEALIGPKDADFMTKMMDALLTLYAYNEGYVRVILEKPPDGADTTGLSMPCKAYLDCDLSGTPLDVYSVFHVALNRLKTLSNDRWKTMAKEVEDSKKWEKVGDAIWQKGSIAPDQWRILVAINAAYLKITAVAALGSMLGYGDADPANGRCALRIEAAVDTWNRAYFLALQSDTPKGTMPAIKCP